MADNLKDAEEMLQLVEAAALSGGLGLNAKKTKAMIFNIPLTSIKTLDDSDLEIVNEFKYIYRGVDWQRRKRPLKSRSLEVMQ